MIAKLRRMLHKMWSGRAWMFFAAFLAVEAAFMAWDIIGRHMVVSDPFVTFVSQYYRLNAMAEYGQIPLWTPFMTQGTTVTWWFALQGNSGFLLNAAVLLGKLLKHIDFFTLFHWSSFVDKALFLAGVWLLAGRYYEQLASRVLVMLGVASGLVLYTQTGFGFFLFYAIPLILWMGHRFLETGHWRYVFGMAYLYLVQAASSVAYHVPMSTFAIALYFACDAACRREEYARHLRSLRFGRTFWMCLAGMALMGAAFAMYLHLARDTGNMVAANPLRSADGSMPIKVFLTYAGNTNLYKWIELILRVSPAWDYTLYMGMLALPAVIAGIIFPQRREARAWVLWSLVILLISMASVVAKAVYYAWPLMKYYRHLGLLAPLVKLGLCFLAGFGFDMLFRPQAWDDARRRLVRRIFLGVMAAAFAGAGIWLFILHGDEAARTRLFEMMVTRGQLTRFSTEALGSDLWPVVMAGVTAIAAGVMAFLIKTPRALMIMAWIWVGLQAVDIAAYRCSQMHLRTVVLDQEALTTTRFQPLTWRAGRDSRAWQDNGRMAVLEAGAKDFAIYHVITNFTFDDYPSTTLRTQTWQRPLDFLLRARTRMPFDNGQPLNAQTPYNLFFKFDHPAMQKTMGILADKVQFFDAAYYSAAVERAAVLVQHPAFAGDVALLSSYEGRPLAEGPDDPVTPEELAANRRLRLPYQMKLYSPNEVIVEVEGLNDRGVWLMYSDVWHPSWRATVNGRSVPVYAADLAYKAVPLEAGKNMVRFYFHAPLLTALQWFFAVAALAGIGITGWACSRALCASTEGVVRRS